MLLYPLSLLLFPCGKRDHRKTFLWKTTWTDGGGRGGGVVDYGRMRLSRRKISKRSLLLFLLLFRIGGWVDLMGFLSSWAEIICPLVFGLSRAEAVILFSALYMSIQQSCFQKGKNPHFWTFPERKDLLFFASVFHNSSAMVSRIRCRTRKNRHPPLLPLLLFSVQNRIFVEFLFFSLTAISRDFSPFSCYGQFPEGLSPRKRGGGEENRLERLESLTHTKKGGERRKI